MSDHARGVTDELQEVDGSMRHARRGRYAGNEMGGSGEDSFVAVVVTKLTGALLFILLLTMVIMALIPRADTPRETRADERARELAIETPEMLPEAVAGRPYALALSASGAQGKVRWSLDGELPAGIVWDETRGLLYGTPESPTNLPLELEVWASDGGQAVKRLVTLAVLDPVAVAASVADPGRASPDLRGWLERGFGFLVLLLVWLLGLGIVGSLERWSGGGGRRFLAYRAAVSVAAMTAAGALGLWLWGPLG